LNQQRPQAATGAIFKRDWWRSYTEPPKEISRIVFSVDTAFKTGEENDWTVCTVWGVTTNAFYLLHLWRERVEFPVLKLKLKELAAEWKPSDILVEDKASGQSLIQELLSSTTLPVKPVKVDSDKVSRAHACTGTVEAGKCFLPAEASWRDTFLDELSDFPSSQFDDITDSVTQALNFLRVPRESGFFAWVREQAEKGAYPGVLVR
jgi:predicted phage terminase large subunit-like protein